MCAPGLKVSVDNPTERMIPSRLKGMSQMAPKKSNDEVTVTKLPAKNPLAIPLKVPGLG